MKLRPDLILCGHINLLPVAVAVKRLINRPILLEAYGFEVWEAGSDSRRRNIQRADLVHRQPLLLEEQRAAVLFDGADTIEHGLPGRVQHRLVVGVQHRREHASGERERAAEILRREIVHRIAPQPHAEPDRLPAR